MTFKIKLAIIAVVLAGASFGGWMARGWFEDSRDLAAQKAQEALAAQVREDMGKVSAHVEQRLSELRANERVIDRGVIREIQKPIYKRVCFEPELVRLLNDAQLGNPAEPAGEVPEGSADAGERQR